MILSFPSRKKSDSRREIRASLIVQLVKNPCAKEKKKKKNPCAKQETPVQFLGREDPLEKG